MAVTKITNKARILESSSIIKESSAITGTPTDLERLEDAYLNDQLTNYVADVLNDGTSTEDELLDLASKSSVIEVSDMQNAINSAKKLSEDSNESAYIDIDRVADYIIDNYNGDLEDRYECIYSIVNSFKDMSEKKISKEVIREFASAHNLSSKSKELDEAMNLDADGRAIKRRISQLVLDSDEELRDYINKIVDEVIAERNSNNSLIEESITDARDYKMVEYTYDGDNVSDYLGHVRVRTDSDKVALRAAEKYAMNKHSEDNPGHFKIVDDNYSNVDVVDSDGDYLTTLESVDKSIKEDRQSDILTIKSNIEDNLVLDNYMGTGKSNYQDYQIELFHDSDNYGGYPWWYVISKDSNILTKRCSSDDLSNALYSAAQFIYNTESESIKESSSRSKYVTRDIINKTNSQKLKDAYDKGELEVLINGDVWYTERCPNGLGKELKAEMKRLYPNIRHLYGESVDSELVTRKQNYLKAKKDFETLGEKDNNDVLSREEKMLIAKAEYEKVLGHPIDESLKEDSSNNGWVKRWNFLDKYYKGDLVISKISSPVDAWHVEKVAPNGHTIKHLGNYKSLEVAMDAAEKHLMKNESKSIKDTLKEDWRTETSDKSINESNNAVYDMYKKQYKNLLQDIKYVLNSDNIEDIRAYDKESQGEYILSKLFDSRMNKQNMSFEDAKEDVIDFLYRTRADAKSELELHNKRSLESKSIMNKVKSELSKDYKLVSESENTLYFKAPDNSTHDDCIAFVDKVVAVSGGKYTFTGRGGSWTLWDILTPEGSHIKAGYDYSNKDNYAVYFKSILTESRSGRDKVEENLTESAIKHIYYHEDPSGLKRGQWLDVKEENGRTLAKWSFNDNWYDITDKIEELPYHRFHNAEKAKTFTFGGWRYWLDDEVEKFWDIEGKRISGDFDIPGMPHVRRDIKESIDGWDNRTGVIKRIDKYLYDNPEAIPPKGYIQPGSRAYDDAVIRYGDYVTTPFGNISTDDLMQYAKDNKLLDESKYTSNLIGPDSLLMNAEESYFDGNLGDFVADTLNDGSATEEELLAVTEKSSFIEYDDMLNAIDYAKSLNESFDISWNGNKIATSANKNLCESIVKRALKASSTPDLIIESAGNNVTNKFIRSIVESQDIHEGTSLKRIARYNEFDNGNVLHNYEKMTSEEAEEMAKQASLDDPDDIYYVAYDDIMDSSSDLRWINGKSYNYSDVQIKGGKPYVKDASVNESIENIPIEDIDKFVDEVKDRFPGSEATYDGDTNTIKITLDDSDESLNEGTVQKSNGKWTNRSKDGKEYGEFDTKEEADAQRKAMFANK